MEQRESWRQQLQGLLLVVVVAIVLRWGVVEPRWIPSESMQPGLQPQDRVLIWKLGHRLGLSPKHNAVVVFRTPEVLAAAGYDPDAALIKRVVGVPGDAIAVQGGQLQRNGLPVNEPWIAEAMNYQLEPVSVGPGQLLVLGDNRNASLDSHLWGLLNEDEVVGTARWRYWPLADFGPITAPAVS